MSYEPPGLCFFYELQKRLGFRKAPCSLSRGLTHGETPCVSPFLLPRFHSDLLFGSSLFLLFFFYHWLTGKMEVPAYYLELLHKNLHLFLVVKLFSEFYFFCNCIK